MVKKFDFVNKIVKQGNSLCVRIPNAVMKQGHLKEGMDANVMISPPEEMYKYSEKNIEILLKIANQIKKLDKHKELKKRFFIMLNFEFLKETTMSNKQETKKRQKEFIIKKKKEFGIKLIEEFIDFAMTLNKEAYTMDGDVAILKQRCQKHLE